MLVAAIRRRAATGITAKTLRSVSTWNAVPQGPPDPILGELFLRSNVRPESMSLGFLEEASF